MDNDKLTVRLSQVLAQESGQDQEVLLYSLTLLKSSLMGYGLLFLVSFIFGVWQYALVAAVTASLFRVFSGGAHASTPRNCSIIGLTLFTIFGLIADSIPPIVDRMFLTGPILVLVVLGFVVFYLYVPADTPGKPINSYAQKKYLRGISFSLLVVWSGAVFYGVRTFVGYPLDNYVVATLLGLSWQVFTLTPLGYSFNESLDTFLKFLLERRRET